MNDPDLDQHRLRLTPHPLQRAGAFAIAISAQVVTSPLDVTPAQFDEVVAQHGEHAAQAALTASKDDNGFFLKQSFSLFPNSPMNHPGRSKGGKNAYADVQMWRTIPERTSWPDAVCALCSVQAVGYFGNSYVPLAASISHRNTTPHGHEGWPLCWPCLTSFYALPYACRLTGGQLSVLHSWDTDFMSGTIARRVGNNRRSIALGVPVKQRKYGPREVAVDQLRRYHRPLVDGVELMVFSNFNGKAELRIDRLDQPTAEWLRSTVRDFGPGFQLLRAAHAGPNRAGLPGLAANLFYRPSRVLTAAVSMLSRQLASRKPVPDYITDLAAVCRSYYTKVLDVDANDAEELTKLAGRIASTIAAQDKAGPLRAFRSDLKDVRRARPMLERWALEWQLDPQRKTAEAMVSRRAYLLLFDPDNPGWLHRSYLFIAVLEQLHHLRWSPEDAAEAAEEVAEEEIVPEQTGIDKDFDEGKELQ